MIRHLAVKPQPAEPPVGQVQVDLLAQPPLGPDGKAVADDEHPDHQFRIDRGTTDGAVEWLQLPADSAEIQVPIDPPQKMIVGNVTFGTEVIEKTLRSTLKSHHRSIPRAKSHRKRNHCSQPPATDFLNKICQEQSLIDLSAEIHFADPKKKADGFINLSAFRREESILLLDICREIGLRLAHEVRHDLSALHNQFQIFFGTGKHMDILKWVRFNSDHVRLKSF